MLAYIVSDTADCQHNFCSWLPEDIETIRLSDVDILCNDIKKCIEPCIVFFEYQKIDKDLLEYLMSGYPFIHFFVICCGKDVHGVVKESLELEDNQIVCECGLLDPEKVNTNEQSKAAIGRVQMFSKLYRSVQDVKNKITSIQRKADSWSRKIRIGSS